MPGGAQIGHLGQRMLRAAVGKDTAGDAMNLVGLVIVIVAAFWLASLIID
jgi:hypothetical protein